MPHDHDYYQELKEKGLCLNCCKPRDRGGALCTICYEKKKEAVKARRKAFGDELVDFTCEQCGNTIQIPRRNSRQRLYCSPKCGFDAARERWRKERKAAKASEEPTEETKICVICGKSFQWLSWMPRNPPQRYCRTCSENSKARRWFETYGWTLGQIVQLWEDQGRCCAICKTPLRLKGKSTHVDHDHKSGKVRGLLCSKCNTGLGMFRDSGDFLVAAAAYLALARDFPKAA